MSTFATALTSWEEFLLGPDAPDGEHYELRDGEVCLVPPARAIHKYLQIWLLHWLTDAAKGLGKRLRGISIPACEKPAILVRGRSLYSQRRSKSDACGRVFGLLPALGD